VERVTFPCALDLVLNPERKNLVAYLQQQNDCFREEYSALASDCDAHIPWATEALGGYLPEAVNLWIGNHLSETSFHKDHYENLYAVVSGEKQFLLLPPTDMHRMYIQDFPAAQYSYSSDGGEFRLELEKPLRYVPWCSVNPYPSPETKEIEMSKFPLYFNGPTPFHCTVKAGEILYL
jgi:jumonji domain-containing protein 7